MSSNTMPERYAPDPWIDRDVATDTRRPGPSAQIPMPATDAWVSVEPGDELRVAPRSARAVTVGPQTPDILGTFRVSAHNRNPEKPRAKVPKFVLKYLDAEPEDTLRFHECDGDHFRIERVEVEP